MNIKSDLNHGFSVTEQQIIREIIEYISGNYSLNDIISKIFKPLQEILSFKDIAIYLFNDEKLPLKSNKGFITYISNQDLTYLIENLICSYLKSNYDLGQINSLNIKDFAPSFQDQLNYLLILPLLIPKPNLSFTIKGFFIFININKPDFDLKFIKQLSNLFNISYRQNEFFYLINNQKTHLFNPKSKKEDLVDLSLYSNQKNILKQLEYKQKLEDSIAYISQQFATHDQVDISQILGVIGQTIGATRLPLHRLNHNKKTFQIIAFWSHNPKIINNYELLEYPLTNFPWWINTLSQNNYIILKNINDLPLNAIPERQFFQSLNISYVMSIPIFAHNGNLWGFIGFDLANNLSAEKLSWINEQETQNIRILKLLGKIIYNYIERQETKSKLLKETEFRTLIFNESTDAIFLSEILNPKYFNIIECNQRAIDLFEAKQKEQLLNIEGHNLQVKPFNQSEKLQILDTLNKKGFWSAEIEYKTFQGNIFWGNIAVKYIYLAGKKLVLARISDITDRKKAEMALTANEQRFRGLVENANDIIYSLNLDGFFTYISPNWTNLLGHDIKEVENHYFPLFVHPEDVTVCWQAVQELMGSKQPQRNIEYRVKHKNGHWCWHFSNISIWQNPVDNTILIVGVARDITERKNFEKQLQKTAEKLRITNEELGRATRLKDEFLANMSHELRTPLNAILGMSEILQEETFGSLSNNQKKYVDTIEKSANHLLSLINDILDLAKIQSGKIELEYNFINVKNLCESSLTFIKPLAFKKQITLKTDIELNLKPIYIDELRIKQVLINFLSNAVKFTPKKGQVMLKVFTHLEQKKIIFQVIDNGIGIAEENLSKLFQSFVQIDSSLSKQYQGTGLGLALVKKIIELHQGEVTVNSELNQGSCFSFSLNYDVHIPHSHQQKILFEQEKKQLIKAKKTSVKLILIAEDNEDNLKLLTEYLAVFNYEIAVAYDGQELIEKAEMLKPNLILMDISLPKIDGLEALKNLKSKSYLQPIPIIVLTAFAMKGDAEKCLNAGANYYISKPYKLKELVTLINKLV